MTGDRHRGSRRRTVLLVAAATWTSAVLVVYLSIIKGQGDSWSDGTVPYAAAALGTSIGACLVATVVRNRLLLVASLVLLAALTLIGAMSIGLLLVPSVVLVAVAMADPPVALTR